MTKRRSTVLALALSALGPAAAQAVVGGVEDLGPLSRASVMVLSSKGGVCSAVVVARDAVLTAAHCVTGAAEHRIHFRDEAGAPVLIAPAAKAVHPGYDAQAIQGRRRSIDLALVRLPAPLPARFGPATLSAGPAGAGAVLRLGGYGVLREGEARSTGTFRSAPLTVVEPHGPSRILVWLEGKDGAGACQGDSGGPIAIGGRVVAVTAWAKGPAAAEDARTRGCGAVSQGVLLGPQRNWIDRSLSGWGRSARWE